MQKRLYILMLLLLTGMFTYAGQQKRFTVMGFGDSITEGGENFSSYLYPLWERLIAAGYEFDFIGPNKSECEIGKLANSGFRGKPVEYLDQITDSIYREYPADFVLIHAGHNHHIDQNPVKGIIQSYRSIIQKILTINPQAHIFLATVTESGKLPKYGYIPKLNTEIKRFVKALNNKQVILVDQNATHDWRTMTIEDKVHPNQLGRERMAEVWFNAMKPYLEAF
ncbi:GDSL-type esterase/lipase family protein [Prevotella sp. P6B1]|uniref:SGNH/GDSL hydrolase family protein n=1 Tax=Prevotella sp. P6B1 TaxID=1410613 RepID=UPI000692497D|nr:GDSL-type esterase/lipase family protein [Prevotella sp. P6B1]